MRMKCKKREEENQKELNAKTDIGWGHQIRSYVLQPYQLVKDLRNKLEILILQVFLMEILINS